MCESVLQMWESVNVRDAVEMCLRVSRAFQVKAHVEVSTH